MARDTLTPAERAAIDAAVLAGRVTVAPSGPAAGLSPLEDRLGPVPPGLPRPWRDQLRSAHEAARAKARGGR